MFSSALVDFMLCTFFIWSYGKKKRAPFLGLALLFVLLLHSRNSQAPSFVKKEVIKKVKPICDL